MQLDSWWSKITATTRCLVAYMLSDGPVFLARKSLKQTNRADMYGESIQFNFIPRIDIPMRLFQLPSTETCVKLTNMQVEIMQWLQNSWKGAHQTVVVWLRGIRTAKACIYSGSNRIKLKPEVWRIESSQETGIMSFKCGSVWIWWCIFKCVYRQWVQRH